jgi:hypothetical protein
MKTVVNVAHEAGQKIGGIGAVLRELIRSRFIAAAEVAEELLARLPRKHADFERLMASGAKVAAEMSWDAVARNYVLQGMDRALTDGRGIAVS